MYVLTSKVKGNVSVVCASTDFKKLMKAAHTELKVVLTLQREVFFEGWAKEEGTPEEGYWALIYNQGTPVEVIFTINQMSVI